MKKTKEVAFLIQYPSLVEMLHDNYNDKELQPTFENQCTYHIYSLSRIAIRPHATQTTDTVACTLSAHSAHHAEIMFPFVFPWRAHYFLCILPIQFLTVCFLLSCCLHSNYHGNCTRESISVFVSPICTHDITHSKFHWYLSKIWQQEYCSLLLKSKLYDWYVLHEVLCFWQV